MKKIGVFGGSFNPIHSGHLAMARLACDHFGLDEMLLVPAAEHPFNKESLTVSAQQRAEMVELAIEDEPLFRCYYGEFERDEVSYAVETVKEIADLYPDAEIYYLIGGDNLPTFHKWHRYEELLSSVVLMVASRPGYEDEIPQELQGDIRFFPSPQWGLSSSVIRNYLSSDLSCRYLVRDSVLEYIEKNKLYG